MTVSLNKARSEDREWYSSFSIELEKGFFPLALNVQRKGKKFVNWSEQRHALLP
jgi:hypothetical protein